MSEMNNMFFKINRKLNVAEEIISKFEDLPIEIIKKQTLGKRIFKK